MELTEIASASLDDLVADRAISGTAGVQRLALGPAKGTVPCSSVNGSVFQTPSAFKIFCRSNSTGESILFPTYLRTGLQSISVQSNTSRRICSRVLYVRCRKVGYGENAVTTGLENQRAAMEIPTDLLRAEAANGNATSIQNRMASARPSVANDIDAIQFDGTMINEGLVRSLRSGAFLPAQQYMDLVTAAAHLAIAVNANVVRSSARGRSLSTVDLVTRARNRHGRRSCRPAVPSRSHRAR